MEISKENIREWKVLKDHGDMRKLTKITGHSHQVLKEAFEGEASEEVFQAINKFYAEKKARVEKSNSSLFNPIA